MQIRLLLELVDEMVKNSLPEWMSREAENENAEETGACRDYDDFFNFTRYTGQHITVTKVMWIPGFVFMRVII